jgi:hypothetical protein
LIAHEEVVMAKKRFTLNRIYQVKITLRNSKPPIWRRVLLPADIRLSDLHKVMQVVMGWTNSHLHQFEVGNRRDPWSWRRYADPEFDLEETKDEGKVALSDLLIEPKQNLTYEYDFGDGWEHIIVLEKILPPQAGEQYPQCVKGALSGPPEDVGGMWGYYHFLEIIQDPNHPEHEDISEWIDRDFDPEEFDLEGINATLRTVFR